MPQFSESSQISLSSLPTNPLSPGWVPSLITSRRNFQAFARLEPLEFRGQSTATVAVQSLA
jgi:hypothetical protein